MIAILHFQVNFKTLLIIQYHGPSEISTDLSTK